MTNPHGSWIWFELLTSDRDAALDFYGKVVGWTVTTFEGAPGDYRILNAGSDGVGGVMSNPMPTGPVWLGYIGVDDVDAAAEKIKAAGGQVHMGPETLPGVGRMAMVEDPQGAKFYVMRGDSPEASKAYGRMEIGKASWTELTTKDGNAALGFYGDIFGWKKAGGMPMPWGEYSFVTLGEEAEMFGAVMPREKEEQPVRWNFYFRVPDIQQAFERVKANGGTPLHDPMEVPGGERVFFATDPQGAGFGLVAPK